VSFEPLSVSDSTFFGKRNFITVQRLYLTERSKSKENSRLGIEEIVHKKSSQSGGDGFNPEFE
jgi:hypothetical protein